MGDRGHLRLVEAPLVSDEDAALENLLLAVTAALASLPASDGLWCALASLADVLVVRGAGLAG